MTGYEIKQGKYVSCRAPGQERFTRLKTLGVDYTEEALRERISRTRTHTVKAPKPQRSGINLLIYIQNCIKAQESKGYEQWAKIHNLKQAAKTYNFLTTHGIEQYGDLTAKIAEVQAASGQAAEALKDVEARLSDMAVLIPNITSLQAEYGQLQAQKETLCVDYGKLKKQVKEYAVIKRNIDSILRQDKEPEYNKEATRE